MEQRRASAHRGPSNSCSLYIPKSWGKQLQRRGPFLFIYFSFQWDRIFWFLPKANDSLMKGCICREGAWTSNAMETQQQGLGGLCAARERQPNCPGPLTCFHQWWLCYLTLGRPLTIVCPGLGPSLRKACLWLSHHRTGCILLTVVPFSSISCPSPNHAPEAEAKQKKKVQNKHKSL